MVFLCFVIIAGCGIQPDLGLLFAPWGKGTPRLVN